MYMYIYVIPVGLFILRPETTDRFPLSIPFLESFLLLPHQCLHFNTHLKVFDFSVMYYLQVSITTESFLQILNKLISSILKNKAKQTSEATKTYLSPHWALAQYLISQLLNKEESAFSVQTSSHTVVHFLTSHINNMPQAEIPWKLYQSNFLLDLV